MQRKSKYLDCQSVTDLHLSCAVCLRFKLVKVIDFAGSDLHGLNV